MGKYKLHNPAALWHGGAHQVKEVLAGLGAHMQQVPEATCHQQRHPLPSPLQQRIGGHCGAHADAGNATGVQRPVPR